MDVPHAKVRVGWWAPQYETAGNYHQLLRVPSRAGFLPDLPERERARSAGGYDCSTVSRLVLFLSRSDDALMTPAHIDTHTNTSCGLTRTFTQPRGQRYLHVGAKYDDDALEGAYGLVLVRGQAKE